MCPTPSHDESPYEVYFVSVHLLRFATRVKMTNLREKKCPEFLIFQSIMDVLTVDLI